MNLQPKHVSCKLRCKFAGKNCNSNQKWNDDKYQCKFKNIKYVKKIMF